MVRIGHGLLKNFLELLSAEDYSLERIKKVGTLRRRAGGKIYESPRIVLPSRYDRFIGRRFGVYHGRAGLRHGGFDDSKSWSQEGDYILLFFPDNWKNEEEKTSHLPEGVEV